MNARILTLNAGSSSIKFAAYVTRADGDPQEALRGQVEGIGAQARLKAGSGDGRIDETRELDGAADHAAALGEILGFLERAEPGARIEAVGHRVVHGGTRYAEPVEIDDAALEALAAFEPFAPLHQPHNLAGVRAAREAFPDARHVACFDTAFHRNHPWVNDAFALPRALYDEGVRRYGFHGLSYEYIAGELERIAPHHAAGRVVVAHLGNGASMCAMRGGRSIGSTMGFSALDGLPMGTRSGQLDPGVVLYLMDQKGMSAAEITALLYKESGLKGLSGGVSHDMRTLEAAAEAGSAPARQAIDYFVFRCRRELGAMCAVLNGIDALVFCGGIGENARKVRARICQGLDWVGLDLDESRNQENARVISSEVSRVRAFVIPTQEELVIGRAAQALLR